MLVISVTGFLVLGKKEETLPLAPLLPLSAPEQISRIKIIRDGKQSLLMTKSATIWQLDEPVKARANMVRITSILNLLQSRVFTAFKVEQYSLSLYGLNPASVVLAMDDTQFYFGDINPIDQGRYVYDGDTVYVVEDTLYPQLLQAEDFFVSTRLIDIDSPLQGIQCGQLFLKKFNSRWQQSTGDAELNSQQMNTILEAWSNLEATRVTLTSGLDSMGKILLDFANGVRIGITIRSTRPELILSPEPADLDYWLPTSMLESLFIPESGC